MSDVLTRLTAALESRYRVSREIGVGGMATVYLAHDLRHERDVAIKVLHPDLAAALGAERFLAEIKTTAKLQHPHILPLLDSGEADGLLFYVMPYVSGESLRARLERETQLAVDDAVRIAREVAGALESAHRQGVIHRDIKPENILLHEDQALVADFGIALAVSAAGGPRMTQTGLSLGTPAYMAPEQAMGERLIDGRADIYALGAVLYEMLLGEAPFTGPTVQAIVARVMTEQPRPITAQRRSVPENVNAVVMKSLEKLPADRFHSAAEMSKALVSPEFTATRTGSAPVPVAKGKRTINWQDVLPWSIAGMALIVAGVSLVRRAAKADQSPLTQFTISTPVGMTFDAVNGGNLNISDDGRTLAFAMRSGNTSQILIRDLSADTVRILPGSSGSTAGTEISPDGQWVAFNADGKLYKARLRGGARTALTEARWAHIAWAGPEALIFTRNYDTGLYRVSSEGKDTVRLTTPNIAKGELGHWWPQLLPDGDHVLFTNFTTPADKSSIEVLSLRSGERKVVLEGAYFGRYADGRLLFVRDRSVMAMPFEPNTLTASGTAVPLPLSIDTYPTNGWAGFAVSNNGTLAYVNDPRAPTELSWVDEGGNEKSAEVPPGNYSEAAPSPDGNKIAVVRDDDVWIFDTARKLFSRLTMTAQRELHLLWSPDSRTVFYARDVPVFDIFRRSVDGSQPEEKVVASADDKYPTSVSPDGRILIYDEDSEADDVMMIRLDSGSSARARSIAGGPGNQEEGSISPDGLWLAYESNESGRSEIYLASVTNRAISRQQISGDGGSFPRWGPDGRTVYYESSGQIIRVRVNPRTGEIGKPEVLAGMPARTFWSIGPGNRFLIGKPARNSEPRSIKVVLNWPALLDSAK